MLFVAKFCAAIELDASYDLRHNKHNEGTYGLYQYSISPYIALSLFPLPPRQRAAILGPANPVRIKLVRH